MIETKRCLLNDIQRSDYKSVKELYTDQEVRQYLGGPRKEETLNRVLNNMLQPDKDCWNWAVRLKQTDQLIGILSLNPHDIINEIKVYYQFFPQWWGNGYAIETVQAIIDYAFNTLELLKIVAVTQVANTPSRRLLEKLDMSLIQTHHRFGTEQAVYSIELK
ncbi:GNAT family N-acetyltransferase [Priestia megaterium]|uniref:GNAT family N-acetyltransferase n=1 Tax=Priestia megaterium TaxID=1404 RepID=UPI002452B7C3|nr:GNAT family N-acetyltransferase [Priestia megaterium]MDH3161242.1 GNAT family N-acetyltransferase [Priestia megaterium]MED4116972.1 GNAT family N-acetyltransferase [Priestia megaterium]